MRFRYLVYPEAEKKLLPLNIPERLKAKRYNGDFPYLGSNLYENDLIADIEEMDAKGYFKTLSKEQEKDFSEGINKLLKEIGKTSWKVERNGKIIQDTLETQDIWLMSGCVSSLLLDKNEVFDYKKYGFDSIFDFTGTIGASIWKDFHGGNYSLRGGYIWESKSHDGRNWVNEIRGSEHMDLRINKTDITPDKTLDPLGNKVSYRPELREDFRCVAGYHSVEGNLLVSILKYTEQNKIESELLNNKGKKAIEFAKSLGQRGGLCAEHFGGFDERSSLFFSRFNLPIPNLDDNFSTKERSFDYVGMQGEGNYKIYVGPDKELIFSMEGEGRNIETKKRVSASFQPSEADHLIKGLIYQSANGLGRTSVKQLINILEYRFSEQFKRDKEKFRV